MRNKGFVTVLWTVFGATVFVAAFTFSLWGGVLFDDTSKNVNPKVSIASEEVVDLEENLLKVRQATHIEVPEAVKAIYMTSCVAGSKSLRDNLVRLLDETELNSIVIDLKTFDGWIAYDAKDESVSFAIGGPCRVTDLQDFIDELHAKNIYVIARVAAFQDPVMVKKYPELAVKNASNVNEIWKDYKGITWIDAGAKRQWEHLVAIAKDAHSIGIDEINFDYIRFPSDGNMRDIFYPESEGRVKADVIEEFFSYLHDNLENTGMVLSADLFGMTTTNNDDLNIGQVLERALPYFDYIAPMVYPSHYPKNFNGWPDPNKKVYEIVKFSMDRAVARTVATTTTVVAKTHTLVATTTPQLYAKNKYNKLKLRPWLQDNNYPVPYTEEMVRAQIQATYDSGLTSWALWNAGNRYTRGALLSE